MIYAYAFDVAGFAIPAAEIDRPSYALRFVQYKSDAALDEADALIIPSGVFEEIYEVEDTFGQSQRKVRFDKDRLAAREKQANDAT